MAATRIRSATTPTIRNNPRYAAAVVEPGDATRLRPRPAGGRLHTDPQLRRQIARIISGSLHSAYGWPPAAPVGLSFLPGRLRTGRVLHELDKHHRRRTRIMTATSSAWPHRTQRRPGGPGHDQPQHLNAGTAGTAARTHRQAPTRRCSPAPASSAGTKGRYGQARLQRLPDVTGACPPTPSSARYDTYNTEDRPDRQHAGRRRRGPHPAISPSSAACRKCITEPACRPASR